MGFVPRVRRRRQVASRDKRQRLFARKIYFIICNEIRSKGETCEEQLGLFSWKEIAKFCCWEIFRSWQIFLCPNAAPKRRHPSNRNSSPIFRVRRSWELGSTSQAKWRTFVRVKGAALGEHSFVRSWTRTDVRANRGPAPPNPPTFYYITRSWVLSSVFSKKIKKKKKKKDFPFYYIILRGRLSSIFLKIFS